MTGYVAERSMINLTLYKVKDPKVAFLCIDGEHEVQRGVMPINQLCALSPLGDDSFQVVAEGVRALRDLLKDAVYHAFLGFLPNLWVLGSVASSKRFQHHGTQTQAWSQVADDMQNHVSRVIQDGLPSCNAGRGVRK